MLTPRGAVIAAPPSLGGPQDSDAVQRLLQKAYVARLRQQLESQSKVQFDTEEQLRHAMQVALPREELTGRTKIALQECEEGAKVVSTATSARQYLEFVVIESLRRKSTLIPWCTNACTYCCMNRLDWAAHIRETHEQARRHLADQEEHHRSTLDLAEEAERARYNSVMLQRKEWEAVFEQQRQLLEQNEATSRREAVAHFETSWRESIAGPWSKVISSVRFAAESLALREKNAAVMRLQDSLSLASRRLDRQYVALLVEEERVVRMQVASTEEVRRGQFMVRLGEVVIQERLSRMQEDFDATVAERDELLAFQERMQKDAAEAATQRVRDIQRALEEEFAELRRLKKAGAEKNPPPFTCPKCGEPPIKDFFTHRMAECSERPVQCTKCDKIMKASALEAHKGVCTHRVIPCPRCRNYYRAAYLETRHQEVCLNVSHARTALQALRPVPLKIEFRDSDDSDHLAPAYADGPMLLLRSAEGAAAVASIGGGGSESNSGSPKTPDALLAAVAVWHIVCAVDGKPVKNAVEARAAISGWVIGSATTVTVIPLHAQPSGLGSRFDVKITVGTTIPLAEYTALNSMVVEDESQYCAPPTAGKKVKK